MQMGFKNRKNQVKTLRVNLTEKVYAKMEEMWPNGFILRKSEVSPRPVSLQPRRMPQNQEMLEGGESLFLIFDSDFCTKLQTGRRIWNKHFDELLLDGIIRKKMANQYCIRQTKFEEIVQESLPTFTADQCRYRMQVYVWKPNHFVCNLMPF
jgi:hypothetical protein